MLYEVITCKNTEKFKRGCFKVSDIEGGGTNPFNKVVNGFNNNKDKLIISTAKTIDTAVLFLLISSISSISVVKTIKSLIESHKIVKEKIAASI